MNLSIMLYSYGDYSLHIVLDILEQTVCTKSKAYVQMESLIYIIQLNIETYFYKNIYSFKGQVTD